MKTFLGTSANAVKTQVSSLEYVRKLRRVLRDTYPFFELNFETGGLIRSAITFGLPAPLDIQVEGNNLPVARGIAEEIQQIVASVSGTADIRIKQRLDYPQVDINIVTARDFSPLNEVLFSN